MVEGSNEGGPNEGGTQKKMSSKANRPNNVLFESN